MDLSRLLSDDKQDGSRGDDAGAPPRLSDVSTPLFVPPSIVSPPVASPLRASPVPLSLPQVAGSPSWASVPRPLRVASGLGAVAGGWGSSLGGDRAFGTRRPLGTAVTPTVTVGVLVERKPSLPSLHQLGIGSKSPFSSSRPGSVWSPPRARAAAAAAATDPAHVAVPNTSPDAVHAEAAGRRMAATAGTAARGAPSPPWPSPIPHGGGASTPPLDGVGRVGLPPTGLAVLPHARHPPMPLRATAAAGGDGRQGASLPGYVALSSTLGFAGAGANATGAPAGFAATGGGGARGAAAADSATLWPRRAPCDHGSVVGGSGLMRAAPPLAAASVPGWGWGAPHGAAPAVDWRSGGGASSAAHGHRSSRSDEAPASSHGGWVAPPLRGSRSAHTLTDRLRVGATIDKRRGEGGHVPRHRGGGSGGGGVLAGGASAKPFECTKCGHQFGQKGSLHRHIRAVHLGLRPHECQKCDKGAFGGALFFGEVAGGRQRPMVGGLVRSLKCCERARVC